VNRVLRVIAGDGDEFRQDLLFCSTRGRLILSRSSLSDGGRSTLFDGVPWSRSRTL
jgi:hypothetical protein